MNSLCVYCGSSRGASPAYEEAAVLLGTTLAEREITLVYGGASVGLMGTLADTVLEKNGRAIGVIPEALVQAEVAHNGLTELFVTSSMHERKAQMAELSDGFVAMPGGIGTLEELFEIWTWGQLGFHDKPFGLLNVEGYFDSLLQFLDHCVDQRFMKTGHRDMLIASSCPNSLIDGLIGYNPKTVTKWDES